MKIPKKDGTTNPKDDSVRNWEDILCDKCGKSCRDSEGMNHEYAEIEAHWGFGSGKDGEAHEAQVCEKCYDGLGIKPAIKDYLFGDGAVCSCDRGNSPVAGEKCRIHSSQVEGG